MKPLMTAEELVAHMKEKGIEFSIISEEDAIDFLSNHNYYLKLASYRTNYKKISSGKRRQKIKDCGRISGCGGRLEAGGSVY